jgi:hypothetical protein
VNIEISEMSSAAKRAIVVGDFETAKACFIEAGDCAVRFQLWRSAFRAFRSALELDLVDPVPVARLRMLRGSMTMVGDWSEYARSLETNPTWPTVRAVGARILSADTGTIVECRGIGPVIEIAMPEPDLIEATPDGRFRQMPRAMALLVVRRALWPFPRERDGMRVRVAWGTLPEVWLDESGDWQPVDAALSSRCHRAAAPH